MDKKDYLYELHRQLNDKNFYAPVQYDPTNHVAQLIKIDVDEATIMGHIDDSTATFLINYFPRVPVFYVLPKIYKPGFPPPSHLIVSGCNFLLEPLSKFLNAYMQPFVSKINSYIRDTKHFITLVEDVPITSNTVLY